MKICKPSGYISGPPEEEQHLSASTILSRLSTSDRLRALADLGKTRRALEPARGDGALRSRTCALLAGSPVLKTVGGGLNEMFDMRWGEMAKPVS